VAVHRHETATHLMIVEDEREHLPSFILFNFAADFKAPDLFIERVEKLLPGRCSGESGAMMLRAAEAAEIEQAFFGAREGHTHAVEEIDDRGSHLAHGFGGRLIGEKVAAVDRVVEVLPRRVALAFGVDRAVDAALRAD
jgi:hypothetical protein